MAKLKNSYNHLILANHRQLSCTQILINAKLLPNEILKVNLDNYSDNGSVGCFLKVNVNYSDDLHDLHLKEIKVTKGMLPEYQLQITEDNEISICKKGKFIPNQVKTNPNLHFKALKLCLKLGLKL